MFDRIRSALAARRAAMLEAEAFVLHYGSDAEAIANALAANPLATDESRRHYARVAIIARRRYALSYGQLWVTRLDQAARFWSSLFWATPSVNVTPSMTRGNWFVPLSLRHVLDAALTRVKTMSLAVFWDSAPLVRTVRCRTVAKTLSIGFEVRR